MYTGLWKVNISFGLISGLMCLSVMYMHVPFARCIGCGPTSNVLHLFLQTRVNLGT